MIIRRRIFGLILVLFVEEKVMNVKPDHILDRNKRFNYFLCNYLSFLEKIERSKHQRFDLKNLIEEGNGTS